MSFETDWDVDFYKTDYESDEHWELRRAFIEAHKDKFPENELVCLAQVFTNIEFLGCRYPSETMERVALLSRDVADQFRKSRATKIKRTFVGASDAAGAKAKGRNTQSTKPIISKNTKIPSLQSTFQKAKTVEPDECEPANNSSNNPDKRKATDDGDDSDYDDYHKPSFSNATASTSSKSKHYKRIPDTGFIIFERIAGSKADTIILHTSAAKQGAVIKFATEASKTPSTTPLNAVVYINGNVYGAAPITQSKQESKAEAYTKALEYARKIHYTIKQKEIVGTVQVGCEEKQIENASTDGDAKNKLCSDNKGFKMMQMLGWTGGALGTSGDGIKEPVSIEMKVDRSGLGLSSGCSKLNYNHFHNYLKKYKADETATYNLMFSKEFDKDERKSLHEIANRLALRSRSRNDALGGRYLVIQKKINLLELANDIYNDGLQARYYKLVAPTHPQPQQKSNTTTQKKTSNQIDLNYRQNAGKNKRQNRQQKFRKF